VENEEAKMVYPSMLKKEGESKGLTNEEVCISYPSMEGKGLEEVKIPRPVDVQYNKMSPGSDEVQIKDVARVIGGNIRAAFEEGNYSVLEHYGRVLEGSDFLDQRLLPQFKALVAEGRGIKNADEGKLVLKKIDGFLSSLRMVKREGVNRHEQKEI